MTNFIFTRVQSPLLPSIKLSMQKFLGGKRRKEAASGRVIERAAGNVALPLRESMVRELC